MVEIIVTENGNVRGVFTRVISASLTDSLNGECTFQFSVISSMASEIFTGLEVQLKSDTLNYLFNVVKVSKSLSDGIAICTVECEHKSYELNNDEYKLTYFFITRHFADRRNLRPDREIRDFSRRNSCVHSEKERKRGHAV